MRRQPLVGESELLGAVPLSDGQCDTSQMTTFCGFASQGWVGRIPRPEHAVCQLELREARMCLVVLPQLHLQPPKTCCEARMPCLVRNLEEQQTSDSILEDPEVPGMHRVGGHILQPEPWRLEQTAGAGSLLNTHLDVPAATTKTTWNTEALDQHHRMVSMGMCVWS